MRTAVIDDGIVINIIEAEPGLELPGFLLVPTDSAGLGWSYIDGEFMPSESESYHTYASITDGAITELGPRPNWYDDSGKPVTNAIIAQHGRLPVVYDEPDYDPKLQRVSLQPQSEWAIESKRVVATYTVHDIPIETLRADKLQQATDMRWQVMTGGMTLPNGVQVGTDIDDQNRITSVVANAELAGLTDADEVDFKAASGWVRITIADVKQIAGAIGQFVQACYTAERTHHEAIQALETREAIAEYDVGQGWPVETEQEPA